MACGTERSLLGASGSLLLMNWSTPSPSINTRTSSLSELPRNQTPHSQCTSICWASENCVLPRGPSLVEPLLSRPTFGTLAHTA
eukprot:scaffold1018_cov420-Prasinococcus_capsulatus_cf.AAC.12